MKAEQLVNEAIGNLKQASSILSLGESLAPIVVNGTGNPDTDDISMSRALDLASNKSHGCVWINGRVGLSQNYSIRKSVGLCGIPGSNATIVQYGKGGRFRWNPGFGIANKEGVTIQSTKSKASELLVPSGELKRGDWFCATSDDKLQEGFTNHSGYGHRTAELHQVQDVKHSEGGYDWVVFNDFIIDKLTQSPRIVKFDMLDGITISDLKFTRGDDTQPAYSYALDIRQAANVTIRNCVSASEPDGNGAGGGIQVAYCGDVLIQNCVLQGQANNRIVYGFVVTGGCNRVLISDSIALGCRHAFTSAGENEGPWRYGTPRNVRVQNVHASTNGANNSSLILFDTHAEGHGIEFVNCRAVLPNETMNPPTSGVAGNRAFSTRSRNTSIIGCTIEGGAASQAINVAASDCTVKGCTIRGVWRGVRIQPYRTKTTTTYGCDRLEVSNCTFEDLHGAAIILDDGEHHRIHGNQFHDVGRTGYSGVSKSAIHLGAEVRGTSIGHNWLPKYQNDMPIGGDVDPSKVEVVGNNMRGYGGRMDAAMKVNNYTD